MPTSCNHFNYFVNVVLPGQKKATLKPAMNQSAMNHSHDMGEINLKQDGEESSAFTKQHRLGVE